VPVLLILAAILVGILIGLLSGGSLRLLSEIQLRWWPLAIAGLLLQLIPVHSGSGGTDWLAVGSIAASYLLLLVFLVANFRLVGIPLIAVGIGLNALVIALNGGMPVSDTALRAATIDAAQYESALAKLEDQGSPKHHLATDDDVLRPLSDVVGLGPPIQQVYSLGDFLSLVGIVWLFVAATRGPPGRHAPGRHAVRQIRRGRPPDLP